VDLNNTDDKQSNMPVTRAIYYYWAAMLSTVIRETGFDVIQKKFIKIKKKKCLQFQIVTLMVNLYIYYS